MSLTTDGPTPEQSLARLSRFSAGAFHPVGPGSVGSPFVHVFVHGWQPGYRVRERLLAMVDDVHALHAWDPRLVDAAGRTLISDYLPLLEALAALGEDHAVLWYSWLDESATDADLLLAYRSRQATQINGRRLALGLQLAQGAAATAAPARRGDPGSQRLHLIGHSHGSAVVTHAALALGRAPEHMTLLDAPESQLSRVGGAADLIDVVLPRLRPGRLPGRVFIDSYISAFGRPYQQLPGMAAVVDVLLAPPVRSIRDPVRAFNAAHLYSVDWYARSVREPTRGVGYGWSPLTGADVSALRRGYRPRLPNRPMDLSPRRHVVPAAVRLSRPRAVRRPVDGVRLEVTVGTPAAASIVLSRAGDQLIEFDLEVEGCDGTELLELGLDGVPAFVELRRLPVPGSGRYLMLADTRPGEHLLTARLSGPGVQRRRRAGDLGPVTGPQPLVRVTHLRAVNRPGTVTGFSLGRTAGAVFGAGAVSGGLATLVALVATEWTARRALAVITRRRRTTPG